MDIERLDRVPHIDQDSNDDKVVGDKIKSEDTWIL
jgi:hypothetical protein